VDFTEVTNPNLSEDNVVGQPNSASAWLTGIERQMALTSNEIVTISEIASDNYVNTSTFFNQALDNLTIEIQDNDFRDLQFDIARLREMSLFGINKVAPGDINLTDETLAEFNFYKGVAFLLAGEYFSEYPIENKGTLQNSAANFQSAIESFNDAISLSPQAVYHLALARAYYNLGDKINAVSSSNTAIGLDAMLLYEINFDQSNGPSSTIESALFARGSFDDLQPLPTLDFLDPKYSFLSNEQDQGTPFLKIEEAHFIITEAQLSDDDLGGAKITMKDLIALISSRPTRTIDDGVEGRTENDPGSRPNVSSVTANYEGDASFKSGLILSRDADVTIPIISGTSITDADVDALLTIDEALEMLYLMRQEVFIAEGRRIVDLGVKYVLHENELLLNSNVDEGSSALDPVIPSFIDAIKSELDAFTYDKDAGTVTIKYNVNKILVDNRTSDLVIPFF
tara:strand:- start:1865 stop:3229 length:1365 start_codon:yes stop_codon:yes gene_type:complete